MEFRNGAPIVEEEGFQKQGSWIPVTPLKPEHANGMVRVHYIRTGESGSPEITTLNHMGVGDGAGAGDAAVAAQMKVYSRGSSSRRWVGDSSMQEAVAAAQMKVYSRGSSSQRSEARSGNNVPLFHQAPVSTTVQGGSGSTGSFLPIIRAQINNGSSQQQPNSTDLLLQMNHNLVMKLPGWMKGLNSNSADGLPANYCIINSITTGDTTSNVGPGTSQQNRKYLENPSAITIDLNELAEEEAEEMKEECPITEGKHESPIIEDVEVNIDKVSSLLGEDMELHTNQVPPSTGDDVHLKKTGEGIPSSTLEPIEPNTNVISTPTEEIKGDAGNDIDLNKRPQRKARKRKHRPKVIREGTAKKTRKKATNQDKVTNQETPFQKKRSVRKRGPKPSATQEEPLTREPRRRRSCKQHLNFDLEGPEEDRSPDDAPVLEVQEEDKSPNKASVQMDKQNGSIVCGTSTLSHMWDSACQTAQDVIPSNGSGSNVQLMKGIGESRAWDAFELTSHMKKMLEDYLQLPEDPNPPSIKEAMNNNAEASASINGSGSNHNLMSQHAYSHIEEAEEIEFLTQSDMDNKTNTPNKNIPLAGSIQGRKRKERNTEDVFDFHSINFPKIYKKKRTSGCKRFMLRTTDVTPFTLDGYCKVGNENTRYPIAGEKNQIHQEFVEPQTGAINSKKLIDDVYDLQIERRIKKKRNVICRIRKSLNMRIAARQCRKAIVVFRGPQSCVEALNAENNAKMRTKQRSNMRRKSHHPNSMQLLTDNSSSHFQTASIMNFPLQALPDLNCAVEYVTQELARLIVSGEKKTEMAGDKIMVPYDGDKIMVPYEGHYTKKRRSRAKVELDAETNRVWKLLMWKEGESSNEIDAEKEKWWEEERRVFQGRAESFIAKMHLVQGDRRFSKWKGSVVDSVIGVFLTQNVSDHLSSSAYMALAARFPLRSQNSSKGPDLEVTSKTAEDEKVCTLDSDESIKWNEESLCQSSGTLHEAEPIEKEIPNLNESFGSSLGGSVAAFAEGKRLDTSESGSEMCNELPGNRMGTSVTVAENANLEDPDYRRGSEDFVSPQVFAVSSQTSIDSTIHTADHIVSSQESNSEDYPTESLAFSFTELLQSQIVGSNKYKDTFANEDRGMLLDEAFRGDMVFENTNSSFKGICCLNGSCSSLYVSNAHEMPAISYSGYQLHSSPGSSGTVEQESVEASGDESRCSLPPNNHESTEVDYIYSMEKRMDLGVETVAGQTNSPQNPRDGDLELEVTAVTGPRNLGEELVQSQNSRTEHTDSHSNLPKHLGETIDVCECSSFVANPPVERTGIKSNTKEEANGSKKMSKETTDGNSHVKKESRSTEKKKDFDWDSLRKQVCQDGPKKERSSDRMDSLDWEAVRCAEVHEVSNTIRERGMNNRLAERIKDFLNRLVRDHGSIDLEWLRDVPPDKAKDYLLSIWGLGLKSVECVRLLTLHHLAFPVDTNVGRICVRLGWVPLQPLPESLQLHLLELYPVLESIQKYLWPRLCTLDQKTLYELHYQMITFGKVFCTKSKPNCNACPLRAECRHFASAFASARLALPCPEEKAIVSSAVPVIPKVPSTPEVHHGLVIDPLPLPPSEGHPHSEEGSTNRICQPIVEEPPEDPCPDALKNEIQASDNDIEDAFWQEDPDEIPTIKLNIEEFTINVHNYMQQNNLELQDMSKALVALTPEAASIPMPKLKNVSRLRTEHQVYELPDSHPLLAGLDRREPDDPCSYLLAIWTPGETAMSTQPPEICCNSQESGNLCDRETCFSCNSTREAQAQTVRGTLLIPCRTAMRGSFPLNGTYFQVNEVFADHDSSLAPINVPRSLIWNLPRRTVYFGTSIPSIFKGLTTEGIQQCFWRGYVCVRGFDQKTRAPRPLIARLHFPASKLVKTGKAAPTNVT